MPPEIDLTEFVRQTSSERRLRRMATVFSVAFPAPIVIAILLVTPFSVPMLYFTAIAFVMTIAAVHVWCRRYWTASCCTCAEKMERRTADIDPVDVGPKLFWNGCHKIDGRFYSWATRPNEVRRLVRLVGVCDACKSFAVISKLEYRKVRQQPQLGMLAGTRTTSDA